MRSAHTLVAMAAIGALVGCNRGDTSQGQSPQSTQFALRTSAAQPGGEARVTLRSGAAGPYVTLIGELTYDASRLTFKDCAVDGGIPNTGGAGNTLNVFQPQPGLVRAVMAGGLQPLPEATDWFTCRFGVAPGSPSGAAAVRLRGNVADTNFADEMFTADGSVAIGG